MSNHNYGQGNNNYNNNSNRRNGGNGNDVSREDFMKVSNWSARCYAEKDLGGKGKVLDCSIAGARNKDGTYGSGDHLDVICLYNKCAMEEANFVGKNIMFDGNYSISDYQKRNGETGKNRKVYATRVWFSSRQPNPNNTGNNNGNNGYRNYNNNNNRGNYQNNGGNRYNNNGYNNSGYNNGNNGYNNNGYNNGNNYQNQNNGYDNGYNSDGYDDFGGIGDDYR
jgi:hypothetical protein